jgi:hypothetical protein
VALGLDRRLRESVLQAPVVIHSMYGSYSIAVVEAGVGVGVAAIVKAAAAMVNMVKIVDCYAAVGQVTAEAQLVVDWQGCFAKEGGKCCCSS